MIKSSECLPLHSVLKTHTSELLGIISDTDKLANDLWSAELVSDQVKEDVLYTLGLSRLLKASKLIDEIYRSLKVFNKPEILVKFCEVLKNQKSPGLTRIAKEILKEIGRSYI